MAAQRLQADRGQSAPQPESGITHMAKENTPAGVSGVGTGRCQCSGKERAPNSTTTSPTPALALGAPNRAKRAVKASEVDAAWFAANPQRTHRLRPAIADEAPGITVEAVIGGTWLAIRQVAPGLRIK